MRYNAPNILKSSEMYIFDIKRKNLTIHLIHKKKNPITFQNIPAEGQNIIKDLHQQTMKKHVTQWFHQQ